MTAASGPLLIAALIAGVAGLVSFLSPCVLPLVPAYLGLVAGMGGSGAEKSASTVRAVTGSVLFVAGFSVVFIAEGIAVGALGEFLLTEASWLTKVIGVFTIVMGLAFMGVFDRVRWFNADFRIHRVPRLGLIGAPLLGVLFGLGWTPCIGPMLAAVLGLASQEATAVRGAILLTAYCIGLGAPFVIVAFASGRAIDALAPIKRHYRGIKIFGGAMLVLLGILEVTGLWASFVAWLQTTLNWTTLFDV